MKTHWAQLIGALCLIAVFGLTAHAADTSNLRFSARVKVTVSAPDNIKGAVSSYLNRELRSLNDVELVDTKPEWEINVLAMELKTVGGYKSGVVLSTVIINSFDNQMLSVFFQPNLKDIGLYMTSSLSWYPDHWMNVGSTDDLQRLCKDIVADFDTKHLEESRKSFRRAKEFPQKSK